MCSLVMLAGLLGQVSPGAPPLQNYSLKCPQGHKIHFQGYVESGRVHAILGPPQPAPQRRAAPGAKPLEYGVAENKLMHLAPGKNWYGGNVTTRPAVGATGELPNRVHVTFIGSQVEREAARKDLEKNPEYQRIAAQMGDLLAVQDYGPENPLVKDVGLVDGGKPDIIIQTTAHPMPLYRAHSYPGSDVLVGEIRRADPRYDPSQDPNGSPLPGGLDLSRLFEFPSSPTEWLIIAGIGCLLVFLVKD